MSEQNTDTTPKPAEPNDSSGRDNGNSASKLLIGGSILAVILIAGLVFSLVIALRGDDAGPLVPADRTADGANTEVEQNLFKPEPVFDPLNRVIYLPLDENGVALPQTNPGSNRPADQAPGGVMLQRIHGNMDLPFSTSDGPTGFTEQGVARGFARTAQGAGLAAAHYVAYLVSGPDRFEMLSDSGFVSDPKGEFAQIARMIPDSSTSTALPMVRVSFHKDLTRVEFGSTMQMKDGSIENKVATFPLVWREGTGWVVQGDSTAVGGRTVPSLGEGWSSWW